MFTRSINREKWCLVFVEVYNRDLGIVIVKECARLSVNMHTNTGTPSMCRDKLLETYTLTDFIYIYICARVSYLVGPHHVVSKHSAKSFTLSQYSLLLLFLYMNKTFSTVGNIVLIMIVKTKFI